MKTMYWRLVAVLLLIPQFIFAEDIQIENPLQYGTIPCFIQGLLKIVVQVGVPVAVVFIVYAGFLFVTAQGSEEQLKKAKHAFMWAAIGSAVLLGAWILAVAIQATLNQITGGEGVEICE